MSVRVIPRLDIKGPNLVKGIHLEGLRVLGKPEDYARYYYQHGADELLYMDVVASLYQRNNLTETLSAVAKEIFIPLTVGGGLRTLDDIRSVLLSGADKVTLNTAAIRTPDLVTAAARKFGTSTITVSIEAIKQPDGTYEAYTDNGRERTGIDAFQWALRAAALGAGELIVTSVDREGTGKGFDLDLTKMIAESVDIPVIACGGAGNLSHVSDVITYGKADAVSLASVLHYGYLERHTPEVDFSEEGNMEYLRNRRDFTNVSKASVWDIKEHLRSNNIDCRPGYTVKSDG